MYGGLCWQNHTLSTAVSVRFTGITVIDMSILCLLVTLYHSQIFYSHVLWLLNIILVYLTDQSAVCWWSYITWRNEMNEIKTYKKVYTYKQTISVAVCSMRHLLSLKTPMDCLSKLLHIQFSRNMLNNHTNVRHINERLYLWLFKSVCLLLITIYLKMLTGIFVPI